MNIMTDNYWNRNGEFQSQLNQLTTLIPTHGDCKDLGPRLESLRIACNAYYDLFNNGGINQSDVIRRIFGLNRSDYKGNITENVLQATESVITARIKRAYLEQFGTKLEFTND